MKIDNVRKIALLMGVFGVLHSPVNVFAAENNDETAVKSVVKSAAKEQIKEAAHVDQKKLNVTSEELRQQIAELERQLGEERDNNERFAQIIQRLERLEKLEIKKDAVPYPTKNQSAYLVNPGDKEVVSYTQDAVNSQGNSTMMFRYAPNQLYKIYCRVGYLTDLAFRQGERMTFVGGGDTSAWAVNTGMVDNVPHLYIKPTVDTSTTNLIVNTDKRSYQLILTTSNWYNPMVSWTYGLDDINEARIKQERDEHTVVGTFSGSLESLNFAYKIFGNAEDKPVVVFDDGERTVLKFNKIPSRIPALFLKERGKKGISLASYTVRGNCYILDRVVDELQLRMSDKEKVKIKRQG